MIKTRSLFAVFIAIAVFSGVALADWTPPNANLTYYQSAYGEASEEYTRIRYGASGPQITAIKEALAGLGFFPYRITENYYRTLESAVRVFAGQLRIGGDGSEITPLMQAMLADAANMPRAVSPAIDHFAYGWEPSNSSYTPYTFSRLSRSGVAQNTRVGFQGTIQAYHLDAGTYTYAVAVDGNAESIVYVQYEPLPRTTVYQVGDSVAVFGTTDGTRALSYDGMDAEALVVSAAQVGYAP